CCTCFLSTFPCDLFNNTTPTTINNNASTFTMPICSPKRITPTSAVKAVPNPAQTAYALDNATPFKDKPKQVNDIKKPIIPPSDGHIKENPSDIFSIVEPNTSKQIARPK